MTADQNPARRGPLGIDRDLVLQQLGGWRGMVDAALPTVAFVVANAIGGLAVGIWAAIGSALLIFALRLARRQSVQQAFSGLFAVAVAVAIAAASGEARDFFAFGILRNAGLAVVLLGSILVRWPLVGVLAEFLAPSHLGQLSGGPLSLRSRRAAPRQARPPDDREPEVHWRHDRRVMRAYAWLTAMWGGMFALRTLVQGLLYQRNDVPLLGTTSLVLGLPVTGLCLVVSLWVVARLHRHRAPQQAGEPPATW